MRIKPRLAGCNSTPIAECEWPQSSKLNKLLTAHVTFNFTLNCRCCSTRSAHIACRFHFYILSLHCGLQQSQQVAITAPKATSTYNNFPSQYPHYATKVLLDDVKPNIRYSTRPGATCASQARRKWPTHVGSQISLHALAFCTQGFYTHLLGILIRMAARRDKFVPSGFSPYILLEPWVAWFLF